MSEKSDYCLLKYLFGFLPINDELSYTYQLHKACECFKIQCFKFFRSRELSHSLNLYDHVNLLKNVLSLQIDQEKSVSNDF
jgi:hypothetical protein